MSSSLEHGFTSWSGQALKHQNSLVDKLDPRGRIVAAFLFALVVVSSSNFFATVSALFAALSIAYLAKLNIKRTLRRVLAMDLFMITLIVILPFTTPAADENDVMFSLFELPATWSGLKHALLITVKANAVILVLLALVGTMNASVLGHALAHLKVPNKLVHLLLFTVRYLDVIGQQYRKMRQAMQARAFVMGTNRHTWQSIGYLFGMLLIRSIERSQRILDAMKCRGFCGQFYLQDEMKLNRLDYLFSTLFTLLLILLIGLNLL